MRRATDEPAPALPPIPGPRSPDSAGHDHDDVAAAQPLKQFSFVQILGPQSSTHAHKVRKAVRVNAAKASAAARKQTIALRQRQQQQQQGQGQGQGQEQPQCSLDVPPPACATPVLNAAAVSPAPLPPSQPTSPPDQPRMSVTSPPATSPAPTAPVVPRPPSDWKLNISHLLNRCTPPPSASASSSSPSPSPSPPPDEPRELRAERNSRPAPTS